MTVNVATAENE